MPFSPDDLIRHILDEVAFLTDEAFGTPFRKIFLSLDGN
jgi:hypothetical protein